MEIPRRNLNLTLVVIFAVVLIAKIGLDRHFTFLTETLLAAYCLLLLLTPKLRNNKLLGTLCLLFVTLSHIITCAGVAIDMWKGDTTLWYGIEARNQRTQPNMPIIAVRTYSNPLYVMFGAVQAGFGHQTVIVCGLATMIASNVALVAMAMSFVGAFPSAPIIMLIYTCPLLYGLMILHDNEMYIQRANVQAMKELKQQQTAAANQQRTVGYIFHEVRNPINNIMLACELARNVLAQIRRTIHSKSPPTSSHSHETTTTTTTTTTHTATTTAAAATSMTPPPSSSTITTSNEISCLCESPIIEEVCQMVDDIHQSAGAAVRVLNDALNLQKLQSGSFEFVHKPFALQDLITTTMRMAQPQMKSKDIQVSITIDAELRELIVDGDFHRLQQVVLNYLSNAYKFTPTEGRVELRMKQVGNREEYVAETGRRTRLRVRISVCNTGVGIKEEDRQKLFQPWSQIRAGDQQQSQGSGLGLALCKAFVEKGHGGTVGFESEPSNVTEFFFEIAFSISLSAVAIRTPPLLKQLNQSRHLISSSTSLTADHSTLELATMASVVPENSRFSSSGSQLIARKRQATKAAAAAAAAEADDQQLVNSKGGTKLPTLRSENSDDACQTGDVDNNNNTTTNDSVNFDVDGLGDILDDDDDDDDDDDGGGMKGDGLSHVVDVMIVEDSAMSRRLLSRTLTTMGVSNEAVNDGQEAVERIEQVGIGYYAVILMDKEMPRMDGYEATKKIRELGFARAVIGCTGNVMDNQVEEFIRAGANHVMSKPVTQETIALSLQRVGMVVQPRI